MHPLTATYRRPNISKVFVWHPYHNARIFVLSVRQCPIAADGSLSADPCIPLDVVLDAGAIVTGNYSSAAILSRDRDGTQAVTSHLNLLVPGHYYFIPDPDHPKRDYPVYRNFNSWKPPSREEIPERWFTADVPRGSVISPGESWIGSRLPTKSNVAREVKELDNACIFSGNGVAIQPAHIIPVSQANWFDHHKVIDQLCFPSSIPPSLDSLASIDDIRNFITLRADLHITWDAHQWALIPYAGSFMAYDLSWTNQNFGWHCFRANMPVRVDGYLLFLRFALLILDSLNNKSTFSEPEDAVYLPSVENDSRSSMSSDEAASRSPTVDNDIPRLMASRYEEYGYLLPDDLAAAWSSTIDEDYEQQKRDWFAEHPQIRSIADPAKVATSSAGFEAASD
ncbi:hypothetical protein OE88DRAFT_1807768, partial [Heliocybe sulcata]